MIFGVGTDLIETDRVLRACEKETFLKRVFTENERREALSNKKRLAGDFAVKEAVAKSFGTGFYGMSFNEIEVLRTEKGRPYIKLHGRAAEFCSTHKINNIQVSIADTDTLVTAFAVAEGDLT